jgi:hypothetical protein
MTRPEVPLEVGPQIPVPPIGANVRVVNLNFRTDPGTLTLEWRPNDNSVVTLEVFKHPQ